MMINPLFLSVYEQGKPVHVEVEGGQTLRMANDTTSHQAAVSIPHISDGLYHGLTL